MIILKLVGLEYTVRYKKGSEKMHLWEVIIVSIGIVLEISITAIIKGANQKQLPTHMFFFISLFFAIIETLLLAVGMVITFFPMQYMHNDRLLLFNKWASAMVLIALGFKYLRKIRKDVVIEEHKETEISCGEVAKLAFESGLDVLLIGIVFALMNRGLIGLCLMFGLTGIAVGVGLWLGERTGNRYQFILHGLSAMILLAMGVKTVVGFFEMI